MPLSKARLHDFLGSHSPLFPLGYDHPMFSLHKVFLPAMYPLSKARLYVVLAIYHPRPVTWLPGKSPRVQVPAASWKVIASYNPSLKIYKRMTLWMPPLKSTITRVRFLGCHSLLSKA
jgi:hypothetical protein